MNKIPTVEYPDAWPIHDWSGVIFGKDDLLNYQTPEQKLTNQKNDNETE